MVLRLWVFLRDSRGIRKENALDVMGAGDIFRSTYKFDFT